MKNALLSKLDALLNSTSLGDADNIFCQMMHDIGYDKFSYNYYPKYFVSSEAQLHVLCTEQTEAWQAHYSAHNYEQIDPIHQHMRKSVKPISWKLENELSKYGKEQNQLFIDAMEFGLRGGFAVPIHSLQGEFANLVIQDVAILNQIKKQPEIEYNLHLIAHYYHAKVSHFLEKSQTATILTVRETECLRLTLQQKTAKEIARILNITPRTVSFHIENAMKKFHVSNKYQAAMQAAQRHLL